MATFRIRIYGAWAPAAIDALRAEYTGLAKRLSEYVENRASNVPDEWAPQARTRLEELGNALDQVGWDRRAKHPRVTTLETGGATIGIALAGILNEVAQVDLLGKRLEFAEDPVLLHSGGRLRSLIALLRSVRAVRSRA